MFSRISTFFVYSIQNNFQFSLFFFNVAWKKFFETKLNCSGNANGENTRVIPTILLRNFNELSIESVFNYNELGLKHDHQTYCSELQLTPDLWGFTEPPSFQLLKI